ncbi:eukaryotic translation initiation factor 4E transporter [Plutella xylostella]|uniref:eukaryotic translation initiation factor 4E transporter n=1 Tax=Plutella xylostella TaxID=51655 RepID=UPI0020323D10|nr:eukaryotic translation initiation factor 4E transporter [Plutella xylostella]
MVSKEAGGEGGRRARRRRRAGARAARRRARRAEAEAGPARCAVHSFVLRYQAALRRVPAHLPPRVHAGPPSKRVKRVSWRDEECYGGGGGGDPAVLALGPARRALVYSREELLRLRNSPHSRTALDAALRGSEALALVLKKRPDSPNDEDRGARGDAPTDKGVYGRERERERRSADPRERVRKESEPSPAGIVLSPQRRSFTSGCGAPGVPAPPPHVARTRPESPLPAPKHDQQAARRIGSGRIMVRDVVTAAPWERTEPEPYRPPRTEARSDTRSDTRGNTDKFERRSFGRDSYSSDIKREREERFNNEKGGRDREDNRRSGSGRFNQRRFDKEDEPEWFSGGPTSQHDTIELRGFDETRDKRNGTGNNTKEDKWNNNRSETKSPPPRRAPSPAPPKDDSTDTSTVSNDKDSGVESKGSEGAAGAEAADFNLDDFLKFDSIPDVLTNGGSETEGSRFSRWFRRESPTHDNRHYERLLNNMVNDLDSSDTSLNNPAAGSQQQFAPISPARPAPPPSLLELLRRANVDDHQMNVAAAAANAGGGKIHSLEELEARLRPQPAPLPDHDLTAFKRLLAQVSGGHAVPAEHRPQPPPPPQPQPQPMSLLQMLNKSMEQQKAPPPPHIPQELVYKLLQVQQRQQQPPEMPAGMGGAGAAMGGAGGNMPPPVDRELLQRPEAQAIIHGLKAGEITVTHLMQQLGNPGLQSRHRDLLLSILRLHQHRQQMGGSPLPAPPAHLVVPPHHQPLRLSPLPHPGVPARIPSPRELAAHTQSIMQSALIKKKLEEQRENYRRRHEPKNTPISFTPTSVLRKMTAEKEQDAPSPKQQQQQQWNPNPPKMPQGRPIVKGNQSGAGPMGYAPSPSEYQQHYLNQQQQMANAIRPFPHQQRPGAQSVSEYLHSGDQLNNLARGVVGGATLQQLLLQSHQRTLSEMGGVGGAGGGDNQLARWFSPELLARASAGKLPSLRVPNALSLEELERGHQSPAVRN